MIDILNIKMTLPSIIDHIYILCNKTKEPERAAFLTRWFGSSGIPESKYTYLSVCYGDTLSPEQAWKVYNPWNKQRPNHFRSHDSYNMKLSEISLCINWAAAAAEAVKANHKVVMIWESDVLPNSEFLEKLHQSMAILETKQGDNWDFLSLSAGAKLRPNRPANETHLDWFPVKNYYHTRTADAMILRVDMLKKILSTYFPVAEVLDWELNFHLSIHKSRSFWLDPPIIEQGSGSGVYPTTL
jgi:hypothetical protein